MKTLINTDSHKKGSVRTFERKYSMGSRRLRERADLDNIAKLLQREAETEEREYFIKELRPLLAHVGNHARRELRLMEAYDLSTIAMLQHRTDLDVQADIDSARDQLRERLRAGVQSHSACQAAETTAAVSTERF